MGFIVKHKDRVVFFADAKSPLEALQSYFRGWCNDWDYSPSAIEIIPVTGTQGN